MSFYSIRRGVELKDDPEFQRRMVDPVSRKQIEGTTATSLDENLPVSARNAVLLFIMGIGTIVILAMFPALRTIGTSFCVDERPSSRWFMLAFGGLILILTGTDVKKVPEGVVFKSGLVAALAIFGIAWMSDTYFQHAMPVFEVTIKDMVTANPWTIAFAMFIVSIVVNSQAAVARMMLPVALGLGLSPQLLIGIMPSVYGYFFIPNYPSRHCYL